MHAFWSSLIPFGVFLGKLNCEEAHGSPSLFLLSLLPGFSVCICAWRPEILYNFDHLTITHFIGSQLEIGSQVVGRKDMSKNAFDVWKEVT